MKVLIRADASLQIGSGHVMRCLTLARAMRQRNWHVEFASREHSGNLISTIQSNGFTVHVLPLGDVGGNLSHSHWLGATQEVDADFLIRSGRHYDWVVVDHYALDREWESRIFNLTQSVFVIDDLGDRVHEGQILLDQNYYLKGASRYAGKVPAGAQILLGPQFALLRDEFNLLRKRTKTRTGPVQRVLVFYGGVDPTSETEKAIEALQGSRFSNLQISVVVGGGNPKKLEIKNLLQSHFPGRSRYFENINNMAELMAWADLMLGAGGTTTWERHCLGLPSLVTAIAENQVEMSKDTADLGGQRYLGRANEVSLDGIAEALFEVVAKPEVLASMSKCAMSVTDGFGTQRVLDVICGKGANT